MHYIARVRKATKSKRDNRVLRRLGNCRNLQEAWQVAKEKFPNDLVVSVMISKTELEKHHQTTHRQ